MALAACGAYTVKNDLKESIKVGETVVSSGECKEFSDGFFGFGSDWPQTITKEDDSAISKDGDAEEEWPAADYLVNAEGVTEADEACEVSEEEPADADEGDKVAETEEDTTPAKVYTKANCEAADSGGTWVLVDGAKGDYCKCVAPKVMNNKTGKCEAKVNTAENCTAEDSGGTWSPQNNNCACPSGSFLSTLTGKCVSNAADNTGPADTTDTSSDTTTDTADTP